MVYMTATRPLVPEIRHHEHVGLSARKLVVLQSRRDCAFKISGVGNNGTPNWFQALHGFQSFWSGAAAVLHRRATTPANAGSPLFIFPVGFFGWFTTALPGILWDSPSEITQGITLKSGGHVTWPKVLKHEPSKQA
jgi:hypothetical protein